ncbi:MAG: exodeoxyribonuclease VII small subunit [Bacilli bacterium]|nr:exodeoxyribonuclease VII small subunit [Bacilli bacterium]
MDEKLDFEKEMKRLDEIIAKMDDSSQSLDTKLKLFDEGNKIIKKLETALKEAESKVEKVVSTK